MGENKLLMFVTTFVFLIFFVTSVSASEFSTVQHTADVVLTPAWSQSGVIENYDVAITNYGPDKIKEVRVYKNPAYTDFVCHEKTGWEGPFLYGNYNDPVTGVPTSFCWWYVPSDSSLVFDDGVTQSFEFSATTPTLPEESCALAWTVETRDIASAAAEGDWLAHQAYTSIDDHPPVVNTTVIGPQVFYKDNLYIKPDETIIRVKATDENDAQCQTGIDYCKYKYSVNGVWNDWQLVDGKGEAKLVFDILFPTDSHHNLKVVCVDKMGHESNFIDEHYIVDGTAPVTEYDIKGPKYVGEFDGKEALFLNGVSNLTLSATDNKFDKYGIVTKYQHFYFDKTKDWKYCTGEYPLDMDNPQEYNGSVIGNFDESCNVIVYKSVDKLNNTESIQYLRFFVDKTAPKMTKEIGEPKFPFEEEKGEGWYLTTNTSISLLCEDIGDHQSGLKGLFYRFDSSSEFVFVADGSHEFNFNELGEKTLEWYCVDNVDKKSNVSKQYYEVIDSEPKIKKTVEGPQFGDCPPAPNSDDECFINTDTNITFYGYNKFNHSMSGLQCTWSYEWKGDVIEGGEFSGDEVVTINFDKESKHILTIECTDKFGNVVDDVERFLVDTTPPVIDKEYIGPFFTKEVDGTLVKWIKGVTNISINVHDPQPHPSGVANTIYRYSAVDDEFCLTQDLSVEGLGEWITPANAEEFMFNLPAQTSCYLLEIKSTDNVGNKEVHKQLVIVDETLPEGVKTIGEPKKPMSLGNIELGYNFFNEQNGFDPALTQEFCAEGDENCMEVTLKTKIDLVCDSESLYCADTSLHFKVDWDGNDVTADYCDEGAMQESGYCLIADGNHSLYFQKETWHRLEFFCEDDFGNVNEPHIEYFKVEGTAFEIDLNAKWNLISVPFKLLDNTMNDVFKMHEDVVSVWGFDGLSWSVWTHDGPSDLTVMEPGRGYWVLTTDASTLRIGGSLLSPTVTPPSIDIVHGWNLIGYYGADNAPVRDGVAYFGGPNLAGEGKPASCALATLTSNLLDAPFPSLWTYWEPNNPNVWMPLDASQNGAEFMNPGAGYWLFFSKDTGGMYGPATANCAAMY